jgi:hypothetical protein
MRCWASRTRECGAGLASLREEHLGILTRIRQEEQQEAQAETANPVLEDRIAAVTEREDDRLLTINNICFLRMLFSGFVYRL